MILYESITSRFLQDITKGLKENLLLKKANLVHIRVLQIRILVRKKVTYSIIAFHQRKHYH